MPTYYVSAAGSDSDDGLTTGTPWLTYGYALANVSDGDSILGNRGDTFRVTGDVEVNNAVTFGAYGTGDNPRIDGSEVVAGWVLDSGSTYTATLTGAPTSDLVWFNADTILVKRASSAAVETSGGWYWAANVLYVRTPDATSPAGHTIEACRTNYLIVKYGPGVDGVTIQNTTVGHAGQHGIYNLDNNGWTIDSNLVENCGDVGIHFNSSANALTGAVVTNNTVRNIGEAPVANYGISAIRFVGCPGFVCTGNTITSPNSYAIRTDSGTYHCSNGTVSGNEISGTYSGIQCFDAPDTVIEDNTIRDGTGFGISAADKSHRVAIRRNLIYNLANTPDEFAYNGIDINSSANPPQNGFIQNNTISGVCATCCTLENAGGAVNGWTVENNIFDARDNTSTSGGGGNGSCLLVAVGTSGTFRNNAYIEQTGNPSHLFYRMGDAYYGYSTMVAIIGETGSINSSDPLFTSTSGGDFTLLESSPCVDAGVTIAGVTDGYYGTAPDIGVFESLFTVAVVAPTVTLPRLWDTADLVARVRRYVNRPEPDELLTDALIYALLTEAHTEELADLSALSPLSQMGQPTLLTSSDGGVTYTFGTDVDGNNVFPLACEVYGEVDGRELRACSWNSWGDFVVEGDKVRMPGNRPQTFSAGPYARFVRADAQIDASTEPTLKPPPARIILVWKALIKFAAIGGIRDPAPFEENYAASKRQWVTAMRTQFADSAGVATEGLSNPAWWISYGRI